MLSSLSSSLLLAVSTMFHCLFCLAAGLGCRLMQALCCLAAPFGLMRRSRASASAFFVSSIARWFRFASSLFLVSWHRSTLIYYYQAVFLGVQRKAHIVHRVIERSRLPPRTLRTALNREGGGDGESPPSCFNSSLSLCFGFV